MPQLKEIQLPREALRRWEADRGKWQASGGVSPQAQRIVQLVERNLRRYIMTALGDGGSNAEKGRAHRHDAGDLGIRGVRGFAADFSGASGSAGSFVVVDRVTGDGRKEWTMHLPGDRGVSVTAQIDAPHFTLRSQGVGATLRGTFVMPADAKHRAAGGLLKAQGPGDFFVVMTLQNGPAPPVQVAGSGLSAKVTVRPASGGFPGQTISLDGTKIGIAHAARGRRFQPAPVWCAGPAGEP